MYQPTISRFFKSSQSSENSQTPEPHAQEGIEGNRNLVHILDSDSDLDAIGALETIRRVSTGTTTNTADDNSVHTTPSHHHEGRSFHMQSSQRDPNFSSRLTTLLNKRSSLDASLDDSDEEMTLTNGKKGKYDKLTELDQQYKDLKLVHDDKILCIRVGYKYKFFARDAEVVSEILQIKLVPGKKSLDGSDPADKNYRKFQYCSIPCTRLHVHLQRLIYCNLKVAVVEQTETSAVKKVSNKGSLFSREIKNVFTKVSYAMNENFDNKEHDVIGNLNTIWAISMLESKRNRKITIISVQLSTGEIIYDEFTDDIALNTNLEARLRHLNPAEIISATELPSEIKSTFNKLRQEMKFYVAKNDTCDELLSALSEIPLNEQMKRLVLVLNSYLGAFENNKVLYFSSNYCSFTSKNYMILPNNTMESLELFENSTTQTTKGSLLWVLDHTRTAFGYKLLRKWIAQPLINRESIEDRLDAVSCIMSEVRCIFFEATNEALKKSMDIERVVNRIAYGNTSRKEVYFFLKQISEFSSLFNNHQKFIQEQIVAKNGSVNRKSRLLGRVFTSINDFLGTTGLPKLLTMINVDAALDKNRVKNVTGFFNLAIYDSADSLIAKRRDIENVRNELEEELINIRRVLKRPTINFKDSCEYLVEIRNTQLKTVPIDWNKVSSTKTVSRFRTPHTEELVQKLRYHEDLLEILSEEEFQDFLSRIVEYYPKLKQFINDFATYDCILSLAATSSNVNFTRPQFSDLSQKIRIKNGRNPIIELLDVNYVPNDVIIGPDREKIIIITGPNMGGKSSYIRQVALLTIMAQIGCYIPADDAELSIFDQVFTRIGAYDDILRSQSTFQVEMSEVLNILNCATPQSLVLLDEVGRGTGTHDGISISTSLLQYFTELDERCPVLLFITHFLSLCSNQSPLVGNYHMSFMESKNQGEKWASVIFLYKLTKGQIHNSYGLNVAKLSSIPTNIINRAFDISKERQDSDRFEDSMALISRMRAVLRTNRSGTDLKDLINFIDKSTNIV